MAVSFVSNCPTTERCLFVLSIYVRYRTKGIPYFDPEWPRFVLDQKPFAIVPLDAHSALLPGMGITGGTMDKFIQRENQKHLRAVLARTDDKEECQRIVKMIDEEKQKKPKIK